MRLMDIILTLPSLLLAIVIVAILGPGLMNAMLAVAVVVLPHYVRITRAAVIAETAKDYVTAARMAGAGRLRLMFIEVLPNCAAPLIVQASLGVSTAILDAAALGFLGLGAQPPAAEWGTMLADAREFVLRAWWVVTFPGPDDPDHGAGLQPARRRPARHARPEAEALTPMALLEVEDLHVEFGAVGAADARRRRREPAPGRRRGARHRRRIGLGQERHDAGADGAGGLSRPGARAAHALRRPRPADAVAARAPQAHGQGRGDDLPGPDHQPEPLLHDRLPAHRDAASCTWAWTSAPRCRAPPSCSSRSASRRHRAGLATTRTRCPAA